MASTGANTSIRSRRAPGVVLIPTSVLAVSLTMAACVGGSETQGQARTPSPAQKSAAQALPTGRATLARFYTQDLAWSKCGEDQCTRLKVPIDYAHPDGDTVKLAVLKVPARNGSDRIGSLLVNPGGPGASAADGYAKYADFIVTKAVRAAYDIVGFDPRGVGSSSPIKCLDDRELDAYLGSDPTPDDQAEEQQFVNGAKVFADKCKAKGGPLLAHVSTVEAAKDMDVLRAALGETKLDYLGKSYGTFIGATYADLFPSKVGRMVLDGAIDPSLTYSQVNEGQAVGFETATRAYVQDCVGHRACPLGDSLNAGMARLRGFLKQLDTKPLPVSDPYVKQLTEGWGSVGIAEAMYSTTKWGRLTDSLRLAFDDGDGRGLMTLANEYARRTDKGTYTSNLTQVIYAVNCLDRADSNELAHYESDARAFSSKAPIWGPLLAWSSAPCGFWPVPGNRTGTKTTAAGSGPILVVGTTRDPATPYKWAQGLASQLANGYLVSFNGDGHTAYTRSNKCVDNAVDNYLLKGRVPRRGLMC